MPRIEYVAFDLETTGLMAEVDRIVEIGAVRFDASGEELGRYERMINPGYRMPAAAQAIHGISDADVADCPSIGEVLPEFLDFLGDPGSTSLLAHHASFDAGFLGRELCRSDLPIPGFGVIDTLALSRAVRPDLPTHRLAYLTKLYGLDPEGPHRALTDSIRVKDLWLRLGGAIDPPVRLVTFPIFDPLREIAAPLGWEGIERAISNSQAIRIEYEGGSRGITPRTISPTQIVQRGGIVYVVAICHLENFEKSFRLDRIRQYDLVAAGEEAKTCRTR